MGEVWRPGWEGPLHNLLVGICAAVVFLTLRAAEFKTVAMWNNNNKKD